MRRKQDTINLAHLIKAARGFDAPSLVIKNSRIINVFTGEIITSNVAVLNDTIVGTGDYTGNCEIDAAGRYLSPGLVDSHIHLESSLLSPSEFTKATAPHGTTAVVIDPHEIANVAGVQGVEEVLANSRGLPVIFYVMAPSCVPASGFASSGAVLSADDIKSLYRRKRAVGLGEVMDVPGLLKAEPDILERIRVSRQRVIDGHAPGLTGRNLNAYCAVGVSSDHETVTVDEGREKLRAGMYLMLRQGSAARNLQDLSALVNPVTSGRCLLVTDDLLPTDIADYGHINHLLKLLVRQGIDPITAIRMATLNAAQRLRLHRSGAVAPGYRADLVLFDDLKEFRASIVIAGGRVIAREGEMMVEVPHRPFSEALTDSVHIGDFNVTRLAVPAADGPCRVIGVVDGQIITSSLTLKPTVLNGRVVADTDRDVLKVAVVERHKGTGNVGVGLIRGFGLKRGAIAGSVAHDAHNVIVVGASDSDMAQAVDEVRKLSGGMVVVSDGKVVAEIALPIAGLLSDRPFPEVCSGLAAVESAAAELGSPLVHPFMTLSFMALEVIPSLKITDRGLVDVEEERLVSLFDFSQGRETGRAAFG